MQVFSHSELGSNERGTQGSNLESPVLETGNSWDSRILSASHSPLPPGSFSRR